MSKASLKIIKNPRITEKTSTLFEGGVYTFDITEEANKNTVSKAIFEIYKVKPVRVNVLKIPTKQTMFKGKWGTKKGGKKAVVYLKKGDKIEFI